MLEKITRKKVIVVGVILAIVAVSSLFFPQKKPQDDYLAGNLHGFNHVKGTSVNWFMVNGYYGKGGGGTCCIVVPAKWTPNQWVKVEWEVDPDAYPTDSPGVTDPKFDAYMKKHEANYRRYQKMVEIPEYGEPCSVDVHFLPCQEVKITLSCHATNHPDYPIKEPSFMEEPAICPQN
ncbi:DUF3304 domain-containing protein [Proteus vulgaris]|uniref:DUF3304 domain-containing protein n=1 Tax=Proteus vulgaris TaxID=585 RepID=UPI001B362CD9|nr:DUF3304 domain-containing protein [Proteus vulgaris]MBQ0214855.1 DUF3304 domain-containing protein [Proteus vulgaris]MDS0789260.1 DUF3304 domain-containing protein [Proteus vulgaris]